MASRKPKAPAAAANDTSDSDDEQLILPNNVDFDTNPTAPQTT